MPTSRARLSVVLFSGGRGSGVLSRQLVTHPDVALTIAINGYDDGASTGKIRRFLGDSLGPSDFRKNASHLAGEIRSCPESLPALLDSRLPRACSREQGIEILRQLTESSPELSTRVSRLREELATTARALDFSDCAVGNLIFAGTYLLKGRQFNAAIDDYCGLLGLPPGLIDNVTDGTNAFLVAVDADHQFLGSEAEIVDAKRSNRIAEVFLIDQAPSETDKARPSSAPHSDVLKWLEAHRQPVSLNSRLRDRIASANLIIYSPGTQHSSLFPSYLTPGLSEAIAGNLTAIKLLVTNIQSDAEIGGSSAVDIIEKAVYYLQEKGRLSLPVPSLISHYIINEPGARDADTEYVPLGQLDALEDPRLVRVGHYEDGVTGRHDASKVLTPFLQAFLTQRSRRRVAIWLHDTDSINKLSQSILEMLRGGIQQLPLDVTVFYAHREQLDSTFMRSLPLVVRNLSSAGSRPGEAFVRALRDGEYDYGVLFESSGMYRGEDLVGLLSPLTTGRLDAVWGSRRLSVKDIEASYRLRYRRNIVLGTLSYVGSHLLSFLYLVLYGRYVSDTLSGARAVRTSFLTQLPASLDDRLVNQYILSALLREKADLLESPVQFLPLSPGRVRRVSVAEGARALGVIAWQRFFGPKSGTNTAPAAGELEMSRRTPS